MTIDAIKNTGFDAEFKAGSNPVISELKEMKAASGFMVLSLLDQNHPDYALGKPNRLLVIKKTGASRLGVQFVDADIANIVTHKITHENFNPTAKLKFDIDTGEGIVTSTKPEDSFKELLRIPAHPKLFDVMK